MAASQSGHRSRPAESDRGAPRSWTAQTAKAAVLSQEHGQEQIFGQSLSGCNIGTIRTLCSSLEMARIIQRQKRYRAPWSGLCPGRHSRGRPKAFPRCTTTGMRMALQKVRMVGGSARGGISRPPPLPSRAEGLGWGGWGCLHHSDQFFTSHP